MILIFDSKFKKIYGEAPVSTAFWAVGMSSQSYTETSTAVTNYTIICNITDQLEILYNASENNSQSLTLEIITDSVAPVINSLQFQYRGLATNTTNLYANMTILLNVMDNDTDL